jgi:hypothetical protein
VSGACCKGEELLAKTGSGSEAQGVGPRQLPPCLAKLNRTERSETAREMPVVGKGEDNKAKSTICCSWFGRDTRYGGAKRLRIPRRSNFKIRDGQDRSGQDRTETALVSKVGNQIHRARPASLRSCRQTHSEVSGPLRTSHQSPPSGLVDDFPFHVPLLGIISVVAGGGSQRWCE